MPDYGFERIGKRLFAEHLVGGNFGNMSVRDGDTGFFIKKTGAYLDTPGSRSLYRLMARSRKTPQASTVSISRCTIRRSTRQSFTPTRPAQSLHPS